MIYKQIYRTPDDFDDLIMIGEGNYLKTLIFINSKSNYEYFNNCEEKNIPIFDKTRLWLDIYFSGNVPEFIPEYKLDDLTMFRKEVIDIMNKITYGKTITYNEIAKIIAEKRDVKKMSAQAVGGAVGWNPICIIIPCHRVVGVNGNLTGYGGGMKNKIALLKLEKNDMSNFFISKGKTINEKM